MTNQLSVGQSPLTKVRATFKKWLHMPDVGALDVTLATYAAHRLPGEPCWLLLVGGPSSGKTEIVSPLLDLPLVYPASTISEANLLSGTSKKDATKNATGGLLKMIGASGILLMKDFTSVLTQNRDTRAKALSALRECYDGSWNRPLGIDGGRVLRWRGKLGIIGGVTSAIDSEHQLMSALGPRFLLHRMPPIDASLQARRALDFAHRETEMRADLTNAVTELFDGLGVLTPDHVTSIESPILSETEHQYLVALAGLVVRARSAVERHPYTRELENVLDTELPARLIRALKQLWWGLKFIGVGENRQRKLIQKVGLDCIPPIRRLVFDYLVQEHPRQVSSKEVTDATEYPRTVIDRALVDLQCHQVLKKRKSTDGMLWSLTGDSIDACADLSLFPDSTD